jgi:hypothetical protein
VPMPLSLASTGRSQEELVEPSFTLRLKTSFTATKGWLVLPAAAMH